MGADQENAVRSALTHNLDLFVVGNCSIAALIDKNARIPWMCLPRFDGDPVFCDLVNHPKDPAELDAYMANPKGGFWDILLEDFSYSEQSYEPNSAIVSTFLYDRFGGCVEVVDFCPRFELHGRTFRPVMLIRRIFRKAGQPRITVRLRPLSNWGAIVPDMSHRGSNHVRFSVSDYPARVTTDVSISYILEERPFLIESQCNFILGPDETLSESVASICAEFQRNTALYWKSFVRSLSIPFEYQGAVIRAAITLKLCCWEESGAIVAALTTSIPEHDNCERCWNYLFNWLRDSYYTVSCLNLLGETSTLEAQLSYILNIVADYKENVAGLQPLFGLTRQTELTESTVESLAGYRGNPPVRKGNGAYVQKQNDSYGSVIAAVSQLFYDERLAVPVDTKKRVFESLEKLGRVAVDVYDKPDAGLWELRGTQRVHTYSAVMCWVACDRLAKISEKLQMPEKHREWKNAADCIHDFVWNAMWNSELNAFVDCAGGNSFDAAVLKMADVGFIEPMHPRFLGTLDAIEKNLRRGNHMYRYIIQDDFGTPKTAFLACDFFLVMALAQVGRQEEARAIFEDILKCRTRSGLLSEDLDFETKELWGNFPQTYSMVGIIMCAHLLSKPWTNAC
eukprot:ANDGO_06186.mRNA.1 Uncharacterized protein C4H3.03c